MIIRARLTIALWRRKQNKKATPYAILFLAARTARYRRKNRMSIQLLRDHPIQALRACFHHSDGSVDAIRAAQFFGVDKRTIYRWIEAESLPEGAKRLLAIHVKGYLPDNKQWEDFYIRGDRMYFNSYHGLRSYTPGMLKAIDLIALPSYRPGSATEQNVFWEKFKLHDTPLKH